MSGDRILMVVEDTFSSLAFGTPRFMVYAGCRSGMTEALCAELVQHLLEEKLQQEELRELELAQLIAPVMIDLPSSSYTNLERSQDLRAELVRSGRFGRQLRNRHHQRGRSYFAARRPCYRGAR